MLFRSTSNRRQLLACAIPVMALLASSCKGVRDKLDAKLYSEGEGMGWKHDSTFVSSNPPVLFRVLRKGSQQFVLPIALLGKSSPLTLRLESKRGWSVFDINFLYSGREITPVQEGFGLAPVKMQRGMWENAAAPLDTMPGCRGTLLPLGAVSLPAGTELAVANYKMPTGMKVLSPGELQEAIREVPLLVMPTVQISEQQLTHYTRTIHQIPRVGGEPGILLEYHDNTPQTDTSVVAQRRPKHVFVVLEKGVYTYRPSWVYSTTGGKTDKLVLHYLATMDADMDGRAEIFFYYEPIPGISYVMAYNQWNDTWKEYWRRTPARCDD